MTTIITRLYEDAAAAQAVADQMLAAGLDAGSIDLIAKKGAGSPEDRMARMRVPAASAAVYAPRIAKGGTLMVAAAPFAPIGTARKAIGIANRSKAVDVGLEDEDFYIREQPRLEMSGKVMQGKVLYMSNPYRSLPHGHVMGHNPIIASKPRTSAIAGGAFMSTKFWPMKLLSAPKERNSAMSGGFLFSSIFGLPTLIHDWPSREMMTTI